MKAQVNLEELEFKTGKRVQLLFSGDEHRNYTLRVTKVDPGEIHLKGLSPGKWVAPGHGCVMEWDVHEGSVLAAATVKELRDDGRLYLNLPRQLEKFGRRESLRLSSPANVHIRAGDRWMRARLVNLSNEGALLTVAQTMEAGDIFRVRFQLPGGCAACMTIGATARVAWVDEADNIEDPSLTRAGIQFCELSPHMRRILDRYVRDHIRDRMLAEA